MSSAYTAKLADAVAALVDASAGGDRRAVEAALGAVEHRVRDIEPRSGLSLATTVAVFERDHWTCRYCGGKTVAPPVLRVLSRLYPEQFPYHPNWKAGRVHPAYLLLSATLDHIKPGGRGGSWSASENLATACWPCNTGKADFTLNELGWQLRTEDEFRSDWDGLAAALPTLWRLAGEPDAPYHRRWLRALGEAA